MKKVRKNWEFYFWLPFVFLISLGMCVASCGKEDENKEPDKVGTVHTVKPNADNILKPDKPVVNPSKNNDVVKPVEPDNPDEVIFEEKLSDYTGNIHISFSNDTQGSLTPCG